MSTNQFVASCKLDGQLGLIHALLITVWMIWRENAKPWSVPTSWHILCRIGRVWGRKMIARVSKWRLQSMIGYPSFDWNFSRDAHLHAVTLIQAKTFLWLFVYRNPTSEWLTTKSISWPYFYLTSAVMALSSSNPLLVSTVAWLPRATIGNFSRKNKTINEWTRWHWNS